MKSASASSSDTSLATGSGAAPSPAARPVALTLLPVGAAGRLHTSQLPREDYALLRALGLTSHCRVRVAKTGDPWIVQVRSTRIGIASSVAQKILVIPEA